MKIKTSKLYGAQLDWAVAQADGRETRIGDYGRLFSRIKVLHPMVKNINGVFVKFEPSVNWVQGGEIIERENINVGRTPSWADGRLSLSSYWCAYQPAALDDDDPPDATRGDAPLIAAMRCYVASKLGDELEIPDELAA